MCAKATMEDFEAMLNESLELDTPNEGAVVTGKVIAIEAGQAIIDIGYKMEGRVELKEFANPGEAPDISVGDEVEVYLERVENARGEAVISREKARREAAWDRLEKAYADEARVEGAIFGRVKGGFTVDLGGAVAFLPGSQVDVRPVRDAGPLMGLKQPFQILKMDRRRGNIVVSRRAILEESRAEQRAEIIGKLAEGQVVDGVVKNITEYGAFVDLGGIDGLLHVTDVVMPGGMGGADLAEAAVGIQPDLRVLFTSGYTDNAIVHHGRLDPGVHLLGKPYRPADLARKVRAVLDDRDE